MERTSLSMGNSPIGWCVTCGSENARSRYARRKCSCSFAERHHWKPVSLAQLSAIAPHALGADANSPKAPATQVDRGRHDQLRHDPRRGDDVEGERGAKEPLPVPKLKPEIAVLTDVCIRLGSGDAVRAHLGRLKITPEVPADGKFDGAVRWVKQRLAKERGAN